MGGGSDGLAVDVPGLHVEEVGEVLAAGRERRERRRPGDEQGRRFPVELDEGEVVHGVGDGLFEGRLVEGLAGAGGEVGEPGPELLAGEAAEEVDDPGELVPGRAHGPALSTGGQNPSPQRAPSRSSAAVDRTSAGSRSAADQAGSRSSAPGGRMASA